MRRGNEEGLPVKSSHSHPFDYYELWINLSFFVSFISSACLLMFESLVRYSWLIIRTVLVIVNNLYCIPTYTVWMFLLLPLKALCPQWYWKIEGRLFHWLLSMVTLWSYSAGYHSEWYEPIRIIFADAHRPRGHLALQFSIENQNTKNMLMIHGASVIVSLKHDCSAFSYFLNWNLH